MTLIGVFAAKPAAVASDHMPLSDATGVAFGSIMSQVQMGAEEQPLLALASAFVASELAGASEVEARTSDSATAIPSSAEEPQALRVASEAPATPQLPLAPVTPEAAASGALTSQASQASHAIPASPTSMSGAVHPSPASDTSATHEAAVSVLATVAPTSSAPVTPAVQNTAAAPTAVSAGLPAVVAVNAAPAADIEARPAAKVTTAAAAPSIVTAPAQPLVANGVSAAEPASATPRAVATQVAPVIMSIVQRPAGSHQVTMTVNPDSLGPVTVRAHISATGDVRVELFGATDAGRDALRLIVVDLRRDLAAAMPNASLSLSSGSASGSGPASDGAAGERASGNAPGQQQPDQGLRPQREPHLSRNTTGPYAAPPTPTETHATPGVALDTFA